MVDFEYEINYVEKKNIYFMYASDEDLWLLSIEAILYS